MSLLLAAAIPVKITSTLNERVHWAVRARKAKTHRETTRLVLRGATPFDHACLPVSVTLTRIGPNELDDDNLAGGFKSVRDGVADWMKLNDRDPRVRWVYRQTVTAKRDYSVLIEIAQIVECE